MINETILKKAIEKAEKNGFNATFWVEGNAVYPIEDWINKKNLRWLIQIIFSHSFAKAFWGEEKVKIEIWTEGGNDDDKDDFKNYFELSSEWQYYLQQMVLEKQPLKYLAKFL